MQPNIFKLIKNKSGFTVLESLIALAILSLTLAHTLPLLHQTMDTFSLNRTLSTFRSDLALVRQHNMTPSRHPLQLKIYPDQVTYEVQTTIGAKTLLKRSLPPGLYFKTNQTQHLITFNGSGNISHAHTLRLMSPYQTKHIVFSIGSGGIDIRDP